MIAFMLARHNIGFRTTRSSLTPFRAGCLIGSLKKIELIQVALQELKNMGDIPMTINQRALIRAKNYILHEINTIEEEGIDRRKSLDAPAIWYGIDRMCAIRDMAAQIVDGKEPNIRDVYDGPPEDFDDENFERDDHRA
jgi:hypothetical protein